jgi:hypothetical protein
MSVQRGHYPLIDEAVKALNNEGFSVDYYLDYVTLLHVVRVYFEGRSIERKIEDAAFVSMGERIVVDVLKEMVAELIGVQVKENRQMTQAQKLQAELDKYKAVVKQLSFDLEMARGSGGSDTAIRVNEIRRMALEQAADYVMDYGIPKSGHDLETLCKQIKELKETRDMAIERAASAMSQQFGRKKDDIPF